MKNTLWTKNFTIITLGTVISAVGGVAMGFALSFVVFDNTGSTLMMALFAAASSLPGIILPVLLSPYLDNFRRKPVIVGLDYLSAVIYLLFGLYLLKHSFSLPLYLLFSLACGSIGSVYNLAYESLYPNLIPEGFAQKGYTVSGMLYPTVTMVMTPVASILYTRLGLGVLCIGEGLLLAAAASVETQIRVEEHTKPGGKFSFSDYIGDFKEGFRYLKKEKGLLRIYGYMPITQGISQATEPLIRAWFRTAPGLNLTMYALFTTAEFIGRTIGGLVHYKFEIPPEKRFSLAYLVYVTYNIMDTVLLWLGFPLMLANRGICGFLGINSATLRESSVQNYLPDNMRAKVNAVFNMLYALVPTLLTLAVGALGEMMDYRLCVTLVSAAGLLPCYLIMWRGREDVKKVYNRKY
ncbi:MAG: MFS transporter [Candidatus Limivicinus sp.]|nr:MFS transporter [Candidatus Limivicinus sp.]